METANVENLNGENAVSSEDKDQKNEPSFEELLNNYTEKLDAEVQVGDLIRGKIISITDSTTFVETSTKLDGVVETSELRDEEDKLTVKLGDEIELYVVKQSESEIRLSKSLSGYDADPTVLYDAYEKKIPVSGKVIEVIKGGFSVTVMQKRAFCPISQIDAHFVDTPEDYVGETLEFLITRIEKGGKNIVISRRNLLEKEFKKNRENFLQEIKPGVLIEGTVTKIMDFGAFVELTPGVEGLVHISELSWARDSKVSNVVNQGDKVTVKVLGIKKNEKKPGLQISLSIKQVSSDPWNSITERYKVGDRLTGKVTQIADFGAFIEIEAGIEGLVHNSELSYDRRIRKASDFLESRQKVYVAIKEIDSGRRRLSLSIRDAEGDPWSNVTTLFQEGKTVSGRLEQKEKFGYFVQLAPGITGLVPRSAISNSSMKNDIEKMQPGEEMNVTVIDVDEDERRITLEPAATDEDVNWQKYTDAGNSSSAFGELGLKLQQALQQQKKE